MSEGSLPLMESQANQSDVPQPMSAGALLRQAREAAGLHVAALAVSMKVPVKKLEALEADRFDLLPDAVFVRALASSVCRALRMDPAPVLQRLPQTVIPRLDTEQRGINAPFHGSGHVSQLSMPAFLAKPVVWVVGILLAGVGILLVLPEVELQEKETDVLSAPGATLATPSQSEIAAESGDSKPAVTVVDVPVPSVPVQVPQVAISQTSVAAAQMPAALAPLPQASTPAQAQPVRMDTSAPTVNLAGSASGVVVFKVTGTSWVEVTDAKGIVQLRKTMAAGEVSAASGALPLAVVVGRADMTQVEVRGKPFALAGIAKDNVARFEVK